MDIRMYVHYLQSALDSGILLQKNLFQLLFNSGQINFDFCFSSSA